MPPREPKQSEQMISKAHLLRQQKQTMRKRGIYLSLITFGVVLLLAVGFFWLPFIQVKQVIMPELLTVDKTEVEQFVWQEISGHIWGVLPSKNIFLINKHSLTASIKERYSTLDAVFIKKDFTKLTFTITERSPKTLWCGDRSRFTTCYFIHDDGTIFDIAGEFSNPLFFVFYTPLETPDDPIGSLVLSKEKFDRINLIQGTLARYGIKVYGYEKQSDNNELFFLSPIVLGGALPAQIKSQETQSTETVVSKTLTAIKNDSLRESQRGKWATLEYIDIRFNDQVSFKLK